MTRFACVLLSCLTLALASRAGAQGATPAEAEPAPAPERAPQDEAPDEAPPDGDTMDAMGASLDDEAARAHFEAARSLYSAGSFALAAIEFDQAYHLSGRHTLLYNVYLAHRDAGQLREAAEALRMYLERVPEPDDRVVLEARLRSLDASLARSTESRGAPSAARDGSDGGERDGHGDDGDGAGGASFGPWLVAGVGAGLLAAAAITGVVAMGKVSDIEARCPGDRCDLHYADAQLRADQDSARGFVRATDWLLLGGALAVASGLTWLLLSSGDGSEAPVTGGVACGSDGCAIALRGRL